MSICCWRLFHKKAQNANSPNFEPMNEDLTDITENVFLL